MDEAGMSTTICFFGDSFVARYEGWIKYLCEKNNYECLHTGKAGADVVYPFEQWKNFNEKCEGKVDICVYAHTGADRLYHPDPTMGLTSGVVRNPPKLHKKLTDKDYQVLKAACDYYQYLSFSQADAVKALIFPMGVDRYIQEHNRVFKKIIHIWSFAPDRRHDTGTFVASSFWPFEMYSGMNVKLDLANLSLLEPGCIHQEFDTRTLHFSDSSSEFISGIVETAIEHARPGAVMDFNNYITPKSEWYQYVSTFKKIKSRLDENSNNRK